MIYFNGYGENTLTFFIGEVATKGFPIIATDDNTAKNATDGQDFIGICKDSNEMTVTVVMDGYVEVPYTGTAPTLNLCSLVSNGTGGVKVSSTAKRNYKVLKVDTVNNIVGFIL